MKAASGHVLPTEEADKLVLEHRSWAEGVARSVARAWNMDWQMDGLDGAAMEALIFCARRFDPARGIPFRGYARKRIHEASTDAARKTKGWVSRSAEKNATDQRARAISAELLNVFPELRNGDLPGFDESGGEGGDGDSRAAIRSLLVGASIVAVKQGVTGTTPEELLDYKRLVELLAGLEPVHQEIMWKVYWEGESMRSVATDWGTDELNIIREHKVLLGFMSKSLATQRALERPRVRPGLKSIAAKLQKSSKHGQFRQLTSRLQGASS